MGVVRPAGQVGRDPVAQGGLRRCQRGTGRAAGTLDHGRRPRKTDGPLFVRGQQAAANPLNVLGAMGELERRIVDGRRDMQFFGVKFAAGQQGRAEQGVFLHREAMTGRQGQNEGVRVIEFHGQDLTTEIPF